jgi:hypothetical protein
MDNKYQDEFTVNLTGETTGEKLEGRFKVRTRLTFRDQLRRDEVRRTILGVAPDAALPDAFMKAIKLAELAVRIILPDGAPSWWKNSDSGLDLSDENVVTEIYEKALEAEKKLVDSLKKDGVEAKKNLQDNPPAAPGT